MKVEASVLWYGSTLDWRMFCADTSAMGRNPLSTSVSERR